MEREITEKEFLEHYKTQVYEKISVTTDLLIFSVSDSPQDNYRKLSDKSFSIYLLKRDEHPFKDKWSLPGGFVDPKTESLEDCAERVLQKKTGLKKLYMEQLYTFGNLNRDPRTRIISTAYMSLIDKNRLSDDISTSDNWFNITVKDDKKFTLTNMNDEKLKFSFSVPKHGNVFQPNIQPEIESNDIAFDHALIIAAGVLRLKNKIEYTDLVFHLLPDSFTLTELQNAYEAILGKKLLAPAFRRMIASDVEKTGEVRQGAGHRPSALFRRIKRK